MEHHSITSYQQKQESDETAFLSGIAKLLLKNNNLTKTFQSYEKRI